MELTIFERMILGGMLPSEGNFATLKLIRQFKEKLSLTEKEIEEIQFRTEGQKFIEADGSEITIPAGAVRWDESKKSPVDIKLTDFEIEKSKEILKKLNDNNKLTERQFSLYEKFFNI